jgi:hypothetical protein
MSRIHGRQESHYPLPLGQNSVGSSMPQLGLLSAVRWYMAVMAADGGDGLARHNPVLIVETTITATAH